MKNINHDDIADIFKEEISKKEKKYMKKKVKESKKVNKRQSKKLEKLEDIEFAKQQLKLEQNEIDIKNDNNNDNNKTRIDRNTGIIKKQKTNLLSFFIDIIFGFSIVTLFLTSIDYLVYNIYVSKDTTTIINSSLITIMSLFFIITLTIKNEKAKKFFAFLATISITGYMIYNLIIV